MRLTDLDPRWLERDGQRLGFVFTSPTKPAFRQSCLFAPTPEEEQFGLFMAALAIDEDDLHAVQPCNPACRWAWNGADFEHLTVTPSLDGSPGGLWHGFITAGRIVGGL